jgi:hypothetical protein
MSFKLEIDQDERTCRAEPSARPIIEAGGRRDNNRRV